MSDSTSFQQPKEFQNFMLLLRKFIFFSVMKADLYFSQFSSNLDGM